jgi:hypothetical protein
MTARIQLKKQILVVSLEGLGDKPPVVNNYDSDSEQSFVSVYHVHTTSTY